MELLPDQAGVLGLKLSQFKRQVVNAGHQLGVQPQRKDMPTIGHLEPNRNRLNGVVALVAGGIGALIDVDAVQVNRGPGHVGRHQQHHLLPDQIGREFKDRTVPAD
jgi:hypothetical protein